VTDTPTTTVEIQPTFCTAAGVYCAVLGIPQLIAAGRARVCCRSYIDDVGEDD
jgi:hypothetical protein